jgi:site-specific DNA-methyltransferase (adenine-specific)
MSELFYLDPMDIKVRTGLERVRNEMGDISDLLESIKKYGQLVPIIVTRENELIDGGRRLAACILGSIPVMCIYNDVVTDYNLRALEIESNIKRKQFTAAEEALAVADLHSIKQKEYGSASTTAGGWSVADTAKLLGKSSRRVLGHIENAKVVEEFPELKNCKSANQIRVKARSLQRIKTALDNLENLPKSSTKFNLYQGDCREHIKTLEHASIDIILTDPPYGIDINETAIRREINKDTKLDTFEDSLDYVRDLHKFLSSEFYRITHEDSHGYIFVAPEFFPEIRKIYQDANWLVWYRPMIWAKDTVGNNNAFHMWPTASYETIMYIRKEQSRITRQNMPDLIQAATVKRNKINYAEKPVSLLSNLLSRVALPGAIIYDPFAGSGAVLEAAILDGYYVIGCERDITHYGLAMERLSKL